MPHVAAWRPGIGDPTAVGWATVVFYLVALGLNKQLDLQSLLTAVGRDIAVAQGWYAQRKGVQLVFVAVVALVGMGAIGLIAATLARRDVGRGRTTPRVPAAPIECSFPLGFG